MSDEKEIFEVNFERDRWEGQMDIPERKALYSVALALRPRFIFEVGTARGGGSTYFLASALANNQFGTLHTSEVSKHFYEYACELYGPDGALHELSPFVEFHYGSALAVHPPILQKLYDAGELNNDPVMFFIDGGYSGLDALYQFCMYRRFAKNGDIIAFHDWKTGKMQSHVQPAIGTDQDWHHIIEVCDLVISERLNTVYAGG